MAEVVDIIHNLSYNVNREGLDTVITKLQEQANGIDLLKTKLAELNKAYTTETNVKQQQNLSGQILVVTDAIEKQTKALKNQFLGNKELQQALEGEIGLIQRLNEFIVQHTKERATLTDVSKIRKYTDEIKAAQVELKGLLTPINFNNNDIGRIQQLQIKSTQIQNAIKDAPSGNGLIQYGKGGIKEYIASLNLELDKTKNEIKELQNAGKEPIINIRQVGAIEALNNRITILKNTLKTVPKENIVEINLELARAQKQLNDLNILGAKKEGSVLGTISTNRGSSFFGGQGNIANQLLQGTLYGLGIGGGFGIITRVVSEAISVLKGYNDQLIYSTKYQYELKDAIDAFEGSMTKQIDKFVEYQKILNAGFGTGEEAAKINVEQVKALGVVKGEQFEASVKQLNAEQDLRKQQLADVESIKSKYQQVADLFLQYDKGGNLNALRKNLTGLGLTPEELRGFIENIDKYLAARQKLRRADQKGFLLSEQPDVPNAILKLDAQANKIQSTIKASEIAFQSKLNEELYQLNIKLKKDIAAANERFAQDEIKRQVQTASTIEKSIESETAFRLKQLAQEKELERKRFAEKGQSLPQNIENDFSEKATQIRREQQAKRIEQTRVYYLQQVKLYEALQTELLAAKVGSGKGRLSQLSPLDEAGNLSLQQDILNDELQLQLSANSAKYSNEVETLEKLQKERRESGKEQTVEYKETQQQLSNIYHEYAQNEEDLIRTSNIHKLNIYADYYAKFIQLVKANEASYLQAIAFRVSIEAGEIREDKGFNFLSKADRQRVAQLRGANTGNRVNTVEDAAALERAQRRSDIADQNAADLNKLGLVANPEAVNAATREQQAALDEIIRINKKIEDAQNNTFDNTKEIRKIYIEQAIADYQLLSSSAVNAFNIISDARQKDLDREIAVRTERLDSAFKLAERGNTVALAQEQKALDAAQKQKRQAALKEQEINAALVVSNALVAVAKAAAEGGVLAPATIALAIAAIGIGFAEAQALSAAQKPQFFKGGYTGEGGKYDEAGTVHKGEFVFNKETTAKHREFFEAIHKGYEPFPVMGLPQGVGNTGNYADKKELREISEKMDMLIGKDVNVSQVVDKSGVHQIVIEENRAHARKWAN